MLRVPTATTVQTLLPLILLLAVSGSAQSQTGSCLPDTAVDLSPGRTAPAAGKSEADRAAQPNKPVETVGRVAAQIQATRPVPTRPAFSCSCGTVNASAVNAPAASQEIPILTGLSGNLRFDHILVKEISKFASTSVASLSVGVGRPNQDGDVIQPFPLMHPYAPNSFWFERPTPPQLTGAYDLVLYFKAPTALGDGAVSNLTSGTVAWEICGYNIPRNAAK